MSYLSNAEILNRWKQCHASGRETAAGYWHEFLLTRAKYGDQDAKKHMSLIKQALNAQEGV